MCVCVCVLPPLRTVGGNGDVYDDSFPYRRTDRQTDRTCRQTGRVNLQSKLTEVGEERQEERKLKIN